MPIIAMDQAAESRPEEETSSLMLSEDVLTVKLQAPHANGKRKLRLALGASAAACLLGVAGVAGARYAFAPCVPGGDSAGIVSLAEVTEDLLHLPDHPKTMGAATQWLIAAQEAGEAAQDLPLGSAEEEAVRQAMAEPDPAKAKQVVDDVMKRAARKYVAKRKGLKGFVENSVLGDARKAVAPLNKAQRAAYVAQARKSQQANTASCVFDVLQATTQVAALAATIANAVPTCGNWNDPIKVYGQVSQGVCLINAAQILYSVSSIASALAVAANNCALTVTVKEVDPQSGNMNALCSAGITGAIQSVAQLAISAAMAAAGCRNGTAAMIPPSFTPANLGAPLGSRRLDAEPAQSAEARRLLIGGGKDAVATFCGVDVTSALWYLAQAGLAINAAANPNSGASCPPRHENHLQGRLSQKEFRFAQQFCAVDVTGAIFGFLQAFYFFSFAAIHCADVINTNAMCSAGVTGLMASLDGFAYAGTSMWNACVQYPSFEKKGFEKFAKSMHMKKQMGFATNAMGNSGIFGRRLEEAAAEVFEEGQPIIAELKERFGTPAEAFKSMGFDITDPHSELMKVVPPFPSERELSDLLQTPQPTAEGSLFGARECK